MTTTAHRRQSTFPRFSWQIEEIGSLTDELGRQPIAQDIARRIRGPERPSVIGVYGSWGSGKTYLLSQVIRSLLEQNCQEKTQVLICVFEAWKYEMEGDLAAGLIKSLGRIEENVDKFCRVRGCCHPKLKLPSEGPSYKDIARDLVHLILEVGPEIASLFTPVARPVGDAVKAARQWVETQVAEPRDTLASVTDKIHQKMDDLVESILNAAEAMDSTKQYRLAIFIDDLDRCSPENMVRMFEWMKVHLQTEKCTYVLALDHIAAARAIVGRYREYLGEERDLAYGFRYLEKLVDIEYELGLTTAAETMAVRQVFRGFPWRRLSDAARDWYGDDFPGWMEIDRLLSIPSLGTPRTMLKIVYKFQNLLQLLQDPSAEELRSRLPASFPFWLLFLIAMYYRLDPEELIAFVQGRSPLHACFQGQNATDEDIERSPSPLKEFCQFARHLAKTTGYSLQMPSPEVMGHLLRLVRENVLVPISE
ncbi:MAG: hypothetical protein H5T61_05895 [Thermoflexales bacterium]|nr:hypothetical protein [Thermoflexales bacterium]